MRWKRGATGSFWLLPDRARSARSTAFCKELGRSGWSSRCGRWSRYAVGWLLHVLSNRRWRGTATFPLQHFRLQPWLDLPFQCQSTTYAGVVARPIKTGDGENEATSRPHLLGWLDVLRFRTIPSGPEQLGSWRSSKQGPACHAGGATERQRNECAAQAGFENRFAGAGRCRSAVRCLGWKVIRSRSSAAAQAHVWNDSGF